MACNSKLVNKISDHVKEAGKYNSPAVLMKRNGNCYFKKNNKDFIENHAMISDLMEDELFDGFNAMIFIVENVKLMEKAKKRDLDEFIVKENENGNRMVYIPISGQEICIGGEVKADIKNDDIDILCDYGLKYHKVINLTSDDIDLLMSNEKLTLGYDEYELILSKKAMPTLRKNSEISIHFKPFSEDSFFTWILIKNSPSSLTIDKYECMYI